MRIQNPPDHARWRILLDLLEVLAVAAIQSAWVAKALEPAWRPDLVFLVIAYKTVTRPLPEALLAATMAGLALDALTAPAYFGFGLASRLVTVAAMHFLAESIWPHKRTALYLLLVCAGALFQNVLSALLAGLAGVQNVPLLLLTALLAALFTTIVGYVLVGAWFYAKGRFGW
jgi:rod shape-determining protein MreD